MITFLSHPFSKCQMTKRCLKWFPKGPLMSLISCLINLSLSDVSLQKTICYMIKPSIISWTMHSNYQGVAWIRSVYGVHHGIFKRNENVVPSIPYWRKQTPVIGVKLTFSWSNLSIFTCIFMCRHCPKSHSN